MVQGTGKGKGTLARLMTARNLQIIDLLARAEQPPCIREIAERTGCSPAKAHQAVRLFAGEGIVTTEHQKNTLRVRPDRSNPLYQRIRSIINISAILRSKAYQELKRQGTISVYGSFARGTDGPQSDVDLLVITDRKLLDITHYTLPLAEELDREVHPYVTTPEHLRTLHGKDYEFAMRLELTRIELNGEQHGPEGVF